MTEILEDKTVRYMKYVENNLRQACLLSDMVPPLKPLKKKAKKGEDDASSQPVKLDNDEDTATPFLLKIDALTKFDINDFAPKDGELNDQDDQQSVAPAGRNDQTEFTLEDDYG